MAMSETKPDPKNGRRPRWTAAQVQAMLAEIERSGETASAWARAHGVDVRRLYSWRPRLLKRAARGGRGETSGRAGHGALEFVPVRLKAPPLPAPEVGGEIEIVVGARFRVRVGRDFDASTLVRVMSVLEGRQGC